MGLNSIHRLLIQGFIALLLVNVVQLSNTIEKDAHLKNKLSAGADLARLSGRIVNGTEATLAQFPHAVSLRYTFSESHFCGGSIISASWILTAAHCMFTSSGTALQPWQFKIVAGDLWLNETSSTNQISAVTQIIVHDDYDSDTFENDIALVKRRIPAHQRLRGVTDEEGQQAEFLIKMIDEFSSTTIYAGNSELTGALTFENPAVQYQILRSDPVAVGTVCKVAGWGYPDYFEREVSNELMYVEVPIMDQPTCAKLYEKYSDIPDGMVCAGYIEGLKDACSGDSGSGLICDDVLTGIVSWGLGCAWPNYPGVYTDVKYYGNWISERLAEGNSGSGAGPVKFSLWAQLLSLALVGLLTRS